MRTLLCVALTILTMFSVTPARAADGLFQFKGLDYTESDLPPASRQRLFVAKQEYYRALTDILQGSVLELHFEDLAGAGGKTVTQVRNELLGTPPPPEQQVRQFFERNRERIQGAYEHVREQLAEHLQTRAVTAKSRVLVARLANDGDFKVLVNKPLPPVVRINTDDRPRKGAAKPKVTIVEFADYKCPHCKHAMPILAGLLKQYSDKVGLVFMDFPIDRTGISREIATGGHCAQQQGRFWEYHDLAFRHQETTNHQSPARLAKTLGMDLAAFRACLTSGAGRKAIAKSLAEGVRIGVSGTPTLYVNGERVFAENLEADLRAAIERAIAKTGG